MSARHSRQVFVISVRPLPGIRPFPALRAALKTLKRRHGLQCISIKPQPRVTRNATKSSSPLEL